MLLQQCVVVNNRSNTTTAEPVAKLWWCWYTANYNLCASTDCLRSKLYLRSRCMRSMLDSKPQTYVLVDYTGQMSVELRSSATARRMSVRQENKKMNV